MNLSTTLVAEAVAKFVSKNSITLTPVEQGRLVSAAELTWNSSKIMSVGTLHAHIFADTIDAGMYRDRAVTNKLGQLRDYPRSDMVYRLMVQVFQPSYQRVLAGDYTAVGRSIEEAAWRVGAMLRSIHPFDDGNRVLSWLIENQLYVQHGLPICPLQKPKPVFDFYRQHLFWDYAKSLMQS